MNATSKYARCLLICLIAVLTLALCSGCAGSATSGSAASASGSNASASTSANSSTATANSYTIEHVSGDPDWSNVDSLDLACQPWGDPVDISATAQLCYSDDALYVRMQAREASIRAEYAADDLAGKPWEDSCLEFFFSPVSNDARYVNFEVNPNCCFCIEVGTDRTDRIRLVPNSDILQPMMTRTDDGWRIEYRIPFSYLQLLYPDFQVKSGSSMCGNFYKCGNLTVQKHYLSWNPMTSDTPDFHRPQDFGTLTFG